MVKKIRKNSTTAMDGAKKTRLRHAIKTFYDLHHDQGKLYTFKEFKECGYNKSQVYRIMDSFDKRGYEDRKVGSGRPQTLDAAGKRRLKKIFNHKTGLFCKLNGQKARKCAKN